ncbi:MAG TPA: DEAD/DEAH box helicase, partial [Gemmatimonadales bacterium]|nr:DEAD/DEAH box helicase [Gemmatimonadales bacterium]
MPAPLSVLVEGRLRRPEIPGRLVVPAGLRAFFLASFGAPVLGVVPGEREAEELIEDLGLFIEAQYLPAWETLPFEHVSPNVGTMGARAVARHAMGSAVVVASVRAVVQRVSPSPFAPITAGVGEEAPLDELVRRLTDAGYHRTDRVETRGELAVRGGIVDVYPAQGDEPVRLDFWGDTIDEVRFFSVATQRSTDPAERLIAFPAREVRSDAAMAAEAGRLIQSEPWATETWDRVAGGAFFAGMESWLPWLAPEQTVIGESQVPVVLFDPARALDRAGDLATEEVELAGALSGTWGKGAADHPALYLPLAVPEGRLLEAPPLAARPGEESLTVTGLDATPGDAASVAAGLGRLIERGIQVVVAMDGEAAADRVSRVLAEHGLHLARADAVTGGESVVIPVGIHHGFVAPELGLAVLGEQEIAGRRRSHRRAVSRTRSEAAAAYGDLAPGDFVVHHHHGIGRFEGMTTQTLAGIERDYLLVAYAGQDRLYVPTDQLAAIRKYTGGESPRLSRMGGADWSRTRSRVRREVAAVAEEVVALHRQRLAVAGHAYPSDTPWQREMEGSFPFEETPDQLRAVADVKGDMEDPGPMDRLIFGDVGFGKTEVAVRAAFKAVQDGRQVAVLVPTTLLAQQHHQTFSERFAPYPVRVEMLSRFLTSKQQGKVLRGLAGGEIDVVVGTHRLLSEDVGFSDLGLLVVDEEQRFGVSAKDRIKALRTSVDVLTLTATPIPRTLEMALTGIRQVSRIATPPEDRHPI